MKTKGSGATGLALPIAAVICAMLGFQIGATLAKQLFHDVGPEGAATLRLTFGAAMLIGVVRPWRNWPRPAPLVPLLGLGLSTAAAILMFFEALNRLPQGMVVALQFLGPLSIAIFGSRRAVDLIWAILAGSGVWLLVGSGLAGGPIDPVGVAWALGAGAGWAGYILFGRAVSASFGASTAGLALVVAAVLVAPIGLQHSGAALFNPALLPLALLVALVSTALPFTLEFYAMPRMPARTFAVILSLEPAFGAMTGFLLLHERLSLAQIAGVAAVIAAAAGAAWSTGASDEGAEATAV